jgi:tetratricopeptide (TPR) repeat protein
VLLENEGRNNEAEDLFKRALDLQEQAAAAKRPDLAAALSFFELGNLYRGEGRLADYESALQQALSLQERVLGLRNQALALTLLTLGDVHREEGKCADAEPVYRRAVEIQEANLGPDDPHLLYTLDMYSGLLRLLDEPDQAKAVAARASALRQKPAMENRK